MTVIFRVLQTRVWIYLNVASRWRHRKWIIAFVWRHIRQIIAAAAPPGGGWTEAPPGGRRREVLERDWLFIGPSDNSESVAHAQDQWRHKGDACEDAEGEGHQQR